MASTAASGRGATACAGLPGFARARVSPVIAGGDATSGPTSVAAASGWLSPSPLAAPAGAPPTATNAATNTTPPPIPVPIPASVPGRNELQKRGQRQSSRAVPRLSGDARYVPARSGRDRALPKRARPHVADAGLP